MEGRVAVTAAIEDASAVTILRQALNRADSVVAVDSVHQCELLILLYSRHTADSDAVKTDVEEAARLDLPILPVRLDNAPFSPSYKYFLAGVEPLNGERVTTDKLVEQTCL